MKIMKMRKSRPYCVQLQAQLVIEHALYTVRVAVKPWTGKDMKESCGGPNSNSSTAEKAKPRVDFQNRISKARYCANHMIVAFG
jgi:hypothetical protein